MKQEAIKNEEMLNRAINHLKQLKVLGNVTKRLRTGKTFWSLQNPLWGTLYYDDNTGNELDETVKNAIDLFETKHPDYLVYHSIVTKTNMGTILSILFVTPDPEEDEFENFSGTIYTYSYVYNLTDPDCFEYGEIGIKGLGGGVVRVA